MPVKLLRAIAVALVLATTVGAAGAQDNKGRPFRIVVPVGPGGGTDIEVRLLQPVLARFLDQTVIVDNRPSAGGIIAGQAVASSLADGNTVLYAGSSFAITAGSGMSLPYDSINDFTYINGILERANIVVVGGGAPFKTAREYLEYARARPSEINVGTTGVGLTIHMGFLLLHSLTNTKVTYVHYKSASQRNVDLMSGRIHATLGGLGGMKPLIDQGKVRAIGVTTKSRIKAMSDLPSLSEVAPDYEFRYWTGFLGPRNLPQAQIDRIANATVQLAQDPTLVRRMEEDAGSFVVTRSVEFKKSVLEDIGRYKKVIAESGIKVE